MFLTHSASVCICVDLWPNVLALLHRARKLYNFTLGLDTKFTTSATAAPRKALTNNRIPPGSPRLPPMLSMSIQERKTLYSFAEIANSVPSLRRKILPPDTAGDAKNRTPRSFFASTSGFRPARSTNISPVSLNM